MKRLKEKRHGYDVTEHKRLGDAGVTIKDNVQPIAAMVGGYVGGNGKEKKDCIDKQHPFRNTYTHD